MPTLPNVVLMKGSQTLRKEAVTAKQNEVNAGLTALYVKYRQRLGMIRTAEDVRDWCRELGREDYDWFYGEVLMMCHPSFVEDIGPDLYNRLTGLQHAFVPQDSWFGLHLKLVETPK